MVELLILCRYGSLLFTQIQTGRFALTSGNIPVRMISSARVFQAQCMADDLFLLN